jgi:predicted SAM-dependent methyltransferase
MKQTPLKLNLGCGTDYKKGWVNIDVMPELKPDLVQDLLQPLPFPKLSVQEVLAQDILEHFTWEDAHTVVAELGRVVKLGGVVTVRVPNVDAIIEQFANDHEVRNEFLYGTTTYTGVFGAHKVGYTPVRLAALFLLNGFEVTTLEAIATNWHVVFTKTISEPHHFLAAGAQQVVVLETFSEKITGSLSSALQNKPVVWIANTGLPMHNNMARLTSKVLYRLVKHIPLLVLVPSSPVLTKMVVELRVSLAKCMLLSAQKNEVNRSSPQYQQALQWAYCLYLAQQRIAEKETK